MSHPNLFRLPLSVVYFCAHDFARREQLSIRKARRRLRQMEQRGEILCYRRPRKEENHARR